MPMLPQPQAILFDLDDTLTLRRDALARFAIRFASDFASWLQPTETAALMGAIEVVDDNGYRPRSEFVAALSKALAWAQIPDESDLLAYWQSIFPQCCAARAGTHETLEWLQSRGITLGVVSNGDEVIQQAKIDALGIRSFFATIVISAAVGVKKPDAHIFRLALAGLCIAPEKAWYVGDHPRNDIWGAAQIGMTSIWLPGGLGWPASLAPPDHQITELTDLVRLVCLSESN